MKCIAVVKLFESRSGPDLLRPAVFVAPRISNCWNFQFLCVLGLYYIKQHLSCINLMICWDFSVVWIIPNDFFKRLSILRLSLFGKFFALFKVQSLVKVSVAKWYGIKGQWLHLELVSVCLYLGLMSIGINCQTESVLTVVQTGTDISDRTGFSKFQPELFFPDSTVYKTVS